MAVAGTLKTLIVKLGVDSAGYTKSLTAAEKKAKRMEKVWGGVAAGVALAMAKIVIDATKLAARVETLDVVINQLGKTAGYTASELDDYEDSIKSQGITTQNTLQSMSQMVQANIDLAEGADLARIAQNNAVIANINSSEAFSRLVTVLQTGNVMMARTMGLNLDFAGATKSLAKEFDKTVAQLSDQEVMQARLNEVKKAGITIEGAYEAAMGTAGKTMLSLDRQIEEISLAVGKLFLPAFTEAVGVVYDFAKGINAGIEAQEDFLEALELTGYEVERGSGGYVRGASFIDAYGNKVSLARDEVIKLAEEQMRGIEAMDAHQASFTGYGVILDEITGKTNDFAEAERSVALALGEVTQATLAKEAMEGLNQAWEEGLISEEDYKSMYQDIATNIAGMEQPATDAALAFFDLKQDIEAGIIPIDKSAQAITDLGIEIGALPDYKQIKIDMLITRIIVEEGGNGGPDSGWQHGGTFTVPPGFPDDSYIAAFTSGERVSVEPAGVDNRDQSRHAFEGAQMNFNRPVDEEVLLEQIRRIAS